VMKKYFCEGVPTNHEEKWQLDGSYLKFLSK
jgi:hypothetical protein